MSAGREVKEHEAIGLLLKGELNVSQIAEKIGVKRTTLLGWPIFREFLDRFRHQAESHKQSRRGRRDGDRDFTSDEVE